LERKRKRLAFTRRCPEKNITSTKGRQWEHLGFSTRRGGLNPTARFELPRQNHDCGKVWSSHYGRSVIKNTYGLGHGRGTKWSETAKRGTCGVR